MITVSRVSFDYNANGSNPIRALTDVSLSIRAGELVALLGHNGSGKSTLAKLMAAVMFPTQGEISVGGTHVTEKTAFDIRRKVGLVFQRPDDQLIANRVIDDIAFGPENLGLPREVIQHRVDSAIATMELESIRTAQISSLSGGERQRVAIAGVLAMEPSCFILDEPTTMIAPVLARSLLRTAHALRDRLGVSIIHITHFMHEVTDFDRIVVMDGGSVLMDGTPKEIFARSEELAAVGLDVPLVTKVGRVLRSRGLPIAEPILTAEELRTAIVPLCSTVPSMQTAVLQSPDVPTVRTDPPFIDVQNASFSYMKDTPLETVGIRNVSCSIHRGQIVAVLGGTQAGKSTLIECLNGLRTLHSGRIFVDGTDIHSKGYDIGALRDRIGVVFQQPETQLFEETVGKDVSFSPRRKKLPAETSKALVERSLHAVGLDYQTFRLRYVYALSGGQKRRVAIAGILAGEPEMLILDEPVAGLDPRGRSELALLVKRLAQESHLTVLIVGNTIDELAELADYAIVMHEGGVLLEGTISELLNQAELLHDVGLELSEAAEIARVLKQQIPSFPTTILHLEELCDTIGRFCTQPKE
jgi:energy-coupling factor transport system ATP-binding protein